ncbi:MAG: penicillin acylase family protein [Bacteroidetes bacterium]|nr:penicillin acylase family protein [Bacteroidota bacterium]MBI3482241.1 penicillin acylase family protein [Bacteroidota bacterium]
MKKILLLLLVVSSACAQKFSPQELSNWKKQASTISIIRDNWGVPHVYGKTDADAVFGMVYAQCEDDFLRVERNYLTATARMAEAEGEEFIYHDLRQLLFTDTTTAISIYKQAPEWLKKLCNAFADGSNYYLQSHPNVKPKLLNRFQPWMPFLFSEGSIGGDIEKISLIELKEFYGQGKSSVFVKEKTGGDGFDEPEPQGSNGIAIAPSISATGNAMLLINPHTSFYFRSELQMVSEEGLNAYGAVTWGQFFIYQGFNEYCGWMHTSSQADVIDEYKELIIRKGDSLFYKYGNEQKPVQSEKISIAYKSGNSILRKEFTVYRTHHGPIIAQRDGKWISVKMMNEPLKALTQSFTRTKSKSFEEFKKSMELRTNSSNNTVYADAQGNIAYWHGNFMPIRDTRFDWSNPVDGSDPATEWKGLHQVDELLHVYNPGNGWIQNCNSSPFAVTGESSPQQKDFPTYMAPDPENARGLHAVRVLQNQKDFTLDKLIETSRDTYLPGFEKLISSFSQIDSSEFRSRPFEFIEPFHMITKWDLRWSALSVSTTLAIYWAQKLRQDVAARIPAKSDQLSIIRFLTEQTTEQEKINAFKETLEELQRDFGTWRVAWGAVNRFQRPEGKIDANFDDGKPSIAVPFTSSFWGSLAAFGSRKYPNTKKMYGNVGNSFIAVVEFGKKASPNDKMGKVLAKSVVTGGSSSDPTSPHFNDQSRMYCDGNFKDVLFYKEDVMKHVERSYRPGE